MPDPDIILQCETIEALREDKEWWAVYEGSFPPSERASKRREMEMAADRHVRILCARENGKTVGLATIQLLEHIPVVFLIALAVSPHERHHHIGSRLFEYGWSVGARELKKRGKKTRGYVWEVEKPELAGNEPQRKERETRLGFYNHLGAELLTYPYIMPPIDGIHTIPMYLMFRPAPGTKNPDKKEFDALVRTIYREKYSMVNHIKNETMLSLLHALKI
ncbi:GNAT family N-acetyltransferase [Candidatus Uhrbacteria bacterium]|nr:GNAT family N-acetyltransferase [Candidatus Uhrbacteria bacterium]